MATCAFSGTDSHNLLDHCRDRHFFGNWLKQRGTDGYRNRGLVSGTGLAGARREFPFRDSPYTFVRRASRLNGPDVTLMRHGGRNYRLLLQPPTRTRLPVSADSSIAEMVL
jgi:hypothetical protein